jgi:2'-5' RNA ligase
MGAGRARGVSLWLMPEGEVRDRIAALIARLAGRFSTPTFPPHVTLLPGIEAPSEGEVLEASRALSRRLRPLEVGLQGVEGREEHFRCLFVRAASDAPLVAAHAAAARAFGREPDPEFLPHLSLVYGTLAPETKGPLAAELGSGLPGSFAATCLHVWRTEGPVGDWREVEVFPLAGEGLP